MSERMNCQDVHDLVFEYRKGELGEPVRALFDEHLVDCPACSEFVFNLGELLRAASEDPEALDPGARDGLWAAIVGDLPAENSQGVVDGSAQGKTRRRIVWAAAAVLLIAGAAAFALSRGRTPVAGLADRPSGPAPTDTEQPLEPQAGDEPAAESIKLLAGTEPVEGLHVHASADSEWTVDESDRLVVVHVRAGDVLLDYSPRRQRRLVVEAPGKRVDVTGTVVLIRAWEDGTDLVLAAGRVRVTDDSGFAVELGPGTVVDRAGNLSSVDSATRAMIDERVDLERHEARLDARQQARIDVESRARRVASAVHPIVPREPAATPGRARRLRADDVADRPQSAADREPEPSLITRAEVAQRDGRYRDAADLLEALLDDRTAPQASAALARLELARIYTHRLDRPGRAVTHLRQLLRRHPRDPAAASARRELCRLAVHHAFVVPECDR